MPGQTGLAMIREGASRKLSLPLSPIGSKIDILLLSTRDVRVRVPSCGIRRRVSLPAAGPFHALSIPVIDTRGWCAREGEIEATFEMQKPSLFHYLCGDGNFRNSKCPIPKLFDGS